MNYLIIFTEISPSPETSILIEFVQKILSIESKKEVMGMKKAVYSAPTKRAIELSLLQLVSQGGGRTKVLKGALFWTSVFLSV